MLQAQSSNEEEGEEEKKEKEKKKESKRKHIVFCLSTDADRSLGEGEEKYLPDIRPFMLLFCLLTLVSDATNAAACVGSSGRNINSI